MAWLYLFLASCFEVCWIYSLKFFNLKKLQEIGTSKLLITKANFFTLLPGIGYVLFGIGNIYFFSKAMNTIPAVMAYAAWTAIALTGILLVDIIVLRESFTWIQLFFMMITILGIAGMKLTS